MILHATSYVRRTVIAAMVICAAAHADDPTHDAFTYQGQLKYNGDPVTGPFNMKFRLYNSAVGGDLVGTELVDNGFEEFDGDGRFTIDLEFGKGIFDGTQLWLEIEVDDVVLSPRQPIMPTPYAIRALNVALVTDTALAGIYNNALHLTNPSNTYVGSGAGLSSLNASNVSTGNLAVSRAPTGGSWTLVTNLNIGNNTLVVDPTAKRVGIGTANAQALLHVQEGTSGMGLYLPGLRVFQNLESPNVIGGYSGNEVPGPIFGATIGGGGRALSDEINRVLGSYGTVGGGTANTASSLWSSIGGGRANTSNGGGSTVSGGVSNTASGSNSFVGGGLSNVASAPYSTVPGGHSNLAGGRWSFAAGRRAKIRTAEQANNTHGDQGTFIWADTTNADFISTGRDQFLIRASGGVGIGTNNPESLLHVLGTIRSTGSESGLLAGNPNNSAASVTLGWLDDVARIRVGGSGSGNTNGLDIQGTGDSSLMRILNTGRVGIGTSTPQRLLHIADGNTGVTSAGNAKFVIESTSNQYISMLTSASSESGILFGNPDGGSSTGGIIYNNSSTADGLQIRTGGNTTRMVITELGRVGVGTTNPGNFLLAVNGSAAKTGGGSWSSFSDARLKHSIELIQPGILDRLLAINGYTFEYHDAAIEHRLALPGVRTGLIAQEVAEVFPDWVEEDHEGYLYITERGTTAIFVEALRELRAEKDALHAEIASLHAETHSMRSELDALHSLLQQLHLEKGNVP